MKMFEKSDKTEKGSVRQILITYLLCIAMPLSVKFCVKQIDEYNMQYNSQQLLEELDKRRSVQRAEEHERQRIAREKEKREMDEFVDKVLEMVNGEND
jgi:signal transduction histidine kinase